MKLFRSISHLILCSIALPCVLLVGCNRNANQVPQYTTAPVQRGDLVQNVTASGTLSALVSVDVGSQISGLVSVLKADFNSPVKKGELVAEIDPSLYQAAVRQAEGDLASAEAATTLARQTLERKQKLVPQRAATQADLDEAISTLAQSQATVKIKKAALEKSQVDLDHCKIIAPVDGIVISRKVDIGQTVAAAMTTPVLFTIAQDITKMHISAAVSEADIGHVANGQSVDFNVDAFPDETFHGKVVQVRMSPTTTENVVTYETIIDVDNPERKLFPGMTADVSIRVAERNNALKVPNAALRFVPPENAKFTQTEAPKLQRIQRLIYVLSNDHITLCPTVIKAGITDGVNTEVQEGLTEGQPAVTQYTAPEKRGGPFGGPPK